MFLKIPEQSKCKKSSLVAAASWMSNNLKEISFRMRNHSKTFLARLMFFLLVSWFETPNRTVLSHDLQEMPTTMIMFSIMKITGSPKRGRSPLCSSGKRTRFAAQSEASRMKSQTALMSLICILIIDIITDDNRDDGWLYCVTVLWYSSGWSFWYEIAQH